MVTDVDLDVVHKALAHPCRRDILAWLKEPGHYFPAQEMPLELGVCAGEIERRCGKSQSMVSMHMATLVKAGLVKRRELGSFAFYERNQETLDRLIAHMAERL